MKPSSYAFASMVARVAFVCLLFAPTRLVAYPPAPSAQYFGSARDAFGAEIKSGDAWVLFKLGDQTIARAEIRTGARHGENYRAMLPLDMGDGEAYVAHALLPGVTFVIEAEIGGVAYPAFGIRPDGALVPEAGGAKRLDFTIGEDSDGDGIPDLWEFWQLERAGIGPSDPRYSLDTLGAGDFNENGVSDYDEYIAGTFSLLFVNTLRLAVKSISPDGWIAFELLEAEGRSYRMQASNDLHHWKDVAAALDGDRGAPVPDWSADATQRRLIEVQLETETFRFFRVQRID